MNFWFYDGTNKVGPLSLDQIKQYNITPNTLVWHSGLPDWIKASEMEELKTIFNTETPPIINCQQTPKIPIETTPTPTMPKTWIVESILTTIFCCMPFGIVGIVFASQVESLYCAKKYKEALDASKKAKTWTSISFWIGIGCLLIWLIYVVILILFAVENNY